MTKKIDTANAINHELLASLKKFIRPLTRNTHDADDVLQNVLLKIMKNGENIPASGFLPWLHKVCHTTSIDYYRKRKSKFIEHDDEHIASTTNDELEKHFPSELAKCVKPLMKNLKPEDSSILAAVELEGISQMELAKTLGINYSALKSKIQRARNKLKAEILDCCTVELDKRNAPIDVRSKKQNKCC